VAPSRRAAATAGRLAEVAAALRGDAAPGMDARRNGPMDAERSEAQNRTGPAPTSCTG